MIVNLLEKFLSCSQVCTDTRNIVKDSMFFALKGANFNGNAFASKAIELGAKYVVVDEEDYFESKESYILVENVLEALQNLATEYRNTFPIPVIGLTGSNGKTTTKEILKSVLETKFNVFATHGNLNNHIGVPLSLLSVNDTHEIAIIEMGANHQGEIAQLSNIAQPDYGLITNVGKAHLEGFGGFEGVIKGKTELYRFIEGKDRVIFYNGDNIHLKSHAERIKKRFAYAVNNNTFPVWVEPKNVDGFLTVVLHCDLGSTEIKSKLTGDYNAENIACAASIGLFFGLTLSEIKEGIESYSPDNNRSQVSKTEKNTLILDAYNANPTSMAFAIENLAKLKAADKMVVLGDMLELGDAAGEEHQAICDLLQKLNIGNGFLVGPIFQQCDSPLSKFEKVEHLQEYLKSTLVKDKTILIKGSRGIKLEKVIEYL
jgi:UDP-N-acetylmuramoyl-tripeptide--D-alanyl-D-alanine ligase